MKTQIIIFCIFSFVIISCEKDEETPIDPIVGNWTLISKSANGLLVEFNDCLAQNNLNFSVDNIVTFNVYFIDEETENCEFSSRTETWSGGNNGNYGVNNGSLFIQYRGFQIVDSQLLYSFEGWNIVDNQVITTDLIFTYEKF